MRIIDVKGNMSVYTYGRVARISDNSYRIMWQLYCRVLTFAASVATVLYLLVQ